MLSDTHVQVSLKNKSKEKVTSTLASQCHGNMSSNEDSLTLEVPFFSNIEFVRWLYSFLPDHNSAVIKEA